MKRIFGLILTVILVFTSSSFGLATTSKVDDILEIPARNKKLAEIIVIEDGTPRSSETSIIIKDGDETTQIVTAERLNKAPTIIRISTLCAVQASITVINECEDPSFGIDEAYLYVQGCLRYFDNKGNYMPDLDGVSPDEATALGAVYCTLARFHSSISATQVAEVEFVGGAKVKIGFTVTYVTVNSTNGQPTRFEKRHYAILPEGEATAPTQPAPSNSPKPSATPSPAPSGVPTATPSPSPSSAPTATPSPSSAPTATPTPSQAPTATPTQAPATNTPKPELDPPDYDEELFDDAETTEKPTTKPTNTPVPATSAPGQPDPNLDSQDYDESAFE